VLGIVRDITEHKYADNALKESENRYRLLFNIGNDALFVYHLTEKDPGKFIEVNDIACERLGYSREELLNLTVADISKLDPGALKTEFKRLLQEKQINLETVHITRDGREIPVEVSANLFALDGRTAVLAIARDITKRLKAEEERERLLTTLKGKNDDLEQIVHISSHDLRSPLVNITGFAGVVDRNIEQAVEMLSGSGKKDAALGQLQHLLEIDTRKAVEHISQGTRRMGSLISGLLRLMRLGKMDIEIQQLNMNALLGEIMHSFSYRIEQAGVQVEIGDLPSCNGDQLQVGQVFSNLFDNALKYLDAERSGVIRVSGQQTGRLVEYCVEDNGIGIAPEDNDRVFQLFHRMNPPATAGEGVGLTLIKKIIDRHGGQVWLESVAGEGSRFYVSLPVKAGGEE
jgi:PAS domain S-box-containing protein